MLERFNSSAPIPVLFALGINHSKVHHNCCNHVTSSPQSLTPFKIWEREITNILSIKLSWNVASLQPAGKQDKVGGYKGECMSGHPLKHLFNL